MQYFPWLRDAGFHVTLWTFLRENDLNAWYGKSQWRRASLALRGVARIPAAVRAIRRADLVIVQREALPAGPPLLEVLAARLAGAVVWDIDDSLWVPYVSPTAGRIPRWLRAPGRKYERIARSATEIWAGSDLLAEWCRGHNDRVRVVPTVVAVPPEREPSPPGGRVVWIGSHSTGEFVERILPALTTVASPLQVRVVGADIAVPKGVPTQVLQWSPASEEAALAWGRVGLYPVDPTHPLADGKCGLKAVLYMSRGIPPVVTPTPTNATIVRNGMEGMHATRPAEWARSVEGLLEDPERWERLSAAAHQRALQCYSLEVWAPRIRGYVENLIKVGS